MANSLRRNLSKNSLLLTLLLFLFQLNAQDSAGIDTVPWYKNVLIYNLEVGTFKDSDGDGIGDFRGLTQQLPYLDTLGVDVIWLAPFHPSPGKDDGYDVQDFYAINPKYGNMQDFEEFMEEAKKREIKVISDMVINHTSIEHAWYQAARSDSSSSYRSWYVWSEERPKDADEGMVFPGVQTQTWTFDSLANAYYFHRFYEFQPDLNFTNEEVQQESYNIMQFWLNKGLDGFRLDAVPFIIDIPETGAENPERMLYLVPELRNAVKEVKPDGLLLGEANLAPKENINYFGKNSEGLQMLFNFYTNQYLFYALATKDLRPYIKALKKTKEKPDASQWANFLRNHDEIDLGRLSDKGRQKVYDQFGPDTSMQLYDRGIRRRLAPMLNNEKQLKMAYSLLFALPGTPVIRYGEEIGMGDDLSLRERIAVRTPMQWSSSPQGGFSTAQKLFRPIINEGEYGYKQLNIEDQWKDPNSLLNFIKNTIDIRKSCPEIGLGDFEILKSSSNTILPIKYNYNGRSLLIIHNFSDKDEEFRISRKGLKGATKLVDLYTNEERALTDNKNQFQLEGFGCKWYSLN